MSDPVWIPPESRAMLLALARAAVRRAAAGKSREPVDPLPDSPPILYEKGATFVTLTQNGRLRGCIGTIEAQDPLWRAVWDAAWDAATGDPRFSPVRPDEAAALKIEISVLTPMREIPSWEEFVAGRDGILISAAGGRGVFLPKVAEEMGWTREQTLTALCKKAGLPPDAWKRPGMKFRTFGAEVFGEPDSSVVDGRPQR